MIEKWKELEAYNFQIPTTTNNTNNTSGGDDNDSEEEEDNENSDNNVIKKISLQNTVLIHSILDECIAQQQQHHTNLQKMMKKFTINWSQITLKLHTHHHNAYHLLKTSQICYAITCLKQFYLAHSYYSEQVIIPYEHILNNEIYQKEKILLIQEISHWKTNQLATQYKIFRHLKVDDGKYDEYFDKVKELIDHEYETSKYILSIVYCILYMI